jgi:cephalosporin hydroxylase
MTRSETYAPLPAIPNDPALIEAMAADPEVAELRRRLLVLLGRYRYAYNWTWHGRPLIQLPSDVMAMQMLVLEHKPDLIIETGVAHGGSLVLYASLMEILGEGRVVGIDIDIREHNRKALEEHPLFKRITLIEGSSIDEGIAGRAGELAADAQRVFVCLDSNHTAGHVARELELYSPFVTPGGYLVVFDTIIEDTPAEEFPDRPWGPGNSPKTAVHAFLPQHPEFEIDREIEQRLLFTVAPDGYLRRVG